MAVAGLLFGLPSAEESSILLDATMSEFSSKPINSNKSNGAINGNYKRMNSFLDESTGKK